MNDKVLLDWAMNPDEELPTQDFDLAVAELCFADVILRLAIDSTCPKRDFFLHCAYLIVGDAVMSSYETRSKSDVEQYLMQVKAAHHPNLDALHERAIALMSDPSSFDYDLWCGGGYIQS
jgi:hypothetical protein